ncbi:MAG: hypothetical protein R3288_04960 [Woeseiaceae bacterium]|nr:hypothetical protein [Woeseiaceae bacterium]
MQWSPEQVVALLVLPCLTGNAWADGTGSRIEAGDFVFLYSAQLGCDEKARVVDYAEIPQNGEIEVFEGIRVSVFGRTEKQVASEVARKIGAVTGRTPKTLSVAFVPKSDEKRLADEFVQLAVPSRCAKPVIPERQRRPDNQFDRFASAPVSLDPSQQARACFVSRA